MTTLLSINNYYYPRGGAEVIFLEHNRLFEEHGWAVVPFAMKHSKNLDSKWSDYFIEEIEYGEQYSLLEKIEKIPKVIYSHEARRKLNRLIDAAKPDIAHAHNIYHHISPSILSLLKQRGLPVLLTVHDLKPACPAYHMLSHDGICERCKGGRLHNVLTHRCIKDSPALSAIIMMEAVLHRMLGSYVKNVDLFVSPSRFYIDKMVEWGFDRNQFVYIPNFVDVSRYALDGTVGDYFLYLGRLSQEKGIATMIEAAAMAGARLKIAGVGPEEQALRNLAVSLNADVTFLGFLSGAKLHDVVRHCRAVILPSEWYENAPVSVLEAYALGKPVIGARVGGIPELIREDETGVTFTSGSKEELSDWMCNFNGRPNNQVSDMGRLGREWVEQQFTPRHYRHRTLEVYGLLGIRS